MGQEQASGWAALVVLVCCIAGWWLSWRSAAKVARRKAWSTFWRISACTAAACIASFSAFCISGGLLLPDPTNAGHIVATAGALLLIPLAIVLWRANPSTQPQPAAQHQAPMLAPAPAPALAAAHTPEPSPTPEPQALPREFLFSYIDHYGQTSRRRVRVMRIASNDGRQYLEGFCLERNAMRTFRVDRIDGDLTDAETGELLNVYMLLASTKARSQMDYTPSAFAGAWGDEDEAFDGGGGDDEATTSATTVLFTGFSRTRKAELEAAARAAGWVVRSTVGPTLDYLVTGPKAGPAKIAKANELLVTVIDEEVFELLAA